MGDEINSITSISGTTKFKCALVQNAEIVSFPTTYTPYNNTIGILIACIEVIDEEDSKIFSYLTYDGILNTFNIEPWNITTIDTGTKIKVISFTISYTIE